MDKLITLQHIYIYVYCRVKAWSKIVFWGKVGPRLCRNLVQGLLLLVFPQCLVCCFFGYLLNHKDCVGLFFFAVGRGVKKGI